MTAAPPTTTDTCPTTVGDPRPTALALRLALTGRAAVVTMTAMIGVALFPVWITAVALSPLTPLAPLVLPATWLVRRYADRHRASAGRGAGGAIPSPYRTSGTGLFARVVTIVRDPASWRDAAWLLAHAVVGFAVALLDVVLVLAGVFYLIFPFLWAVTPDGVFRTELGVTTIDTTAKSFVMMPLALVAFGLWWALTVPLARVETGLTRALLAPRDR